MTSGQGITGKLKMWETNLPISLVPNPSTKGVNTVLHSSVKEIWHFQSNGPVRKLPFPAGSSARCILQGNLKRRQNNYLTSAQVHQGDGTNTLSGKQVPAPVPLLSLQMTPENSNHLVFLLKKPREASLATSN